MANEGIKRSTACTTHLDAEPPDDDAAAVPVDPFEMEYALGSNLTRNSPTKVGDDVFSVGLNDHGEPHLELVDLLRQHREAMSLDGRPGRVEDHDMGIQLQPGTRMRAEPPRRASPEMCFVHSGTDLDGK